ncbi:MAG: hypothetical protein HYR75_07895 [Gemmatimonadetes bacterium]|nr:hypothetical protein [Gemmatimonadota bacterium]MBI3567592.1 hypothetical protein [Gemmatimonadota bacterium]
MKRIVWIVCMVALAAPMMATAQRADTSVARLSAVARAAVDVYNAPGTRRVTGAFDVPAGSVIAGDVAVLNGPATIAGRIDGSLVAINADVRFAKGAQIGQQLMVVGGGMVGQDGATIGGDIRSQAELLRYHLEGERLVPDADPVYDDSWWNRHRVRHEFRRGEAFTDFFYVASRAYNRVEGWSIVAGPRFQRTPAWGKINVEAFGVVRTARPIRWDDQTLGHEARAEVQFGKPMGVALGGRLFDVVAPTESWQLGNTEVGLASALLHRDYRDYYGRHGGEVYARFQATDDADLTLAFSNERWADVRDRDPWSLLRGDEPWRANPTMDPGDMHLTTARLRVDTRDGKGSAWMTGWYLNAELENGAGMLTRFGAPVMTLGGFAIPSPEHVDYTRGFVDARRYLKVAPDLFVNFRAAGGGWLAGDALPTQRRLGLGGPGTLPGFSFRDASLTPDLLNCTGGFTQPGTPAQCDRVALLQVELRSGFFWSAIRDDATEDWWRPGFNHRAQWVLFADAGRGWRVGTPDGRLTYSDHTVPGFDSYKTDLGIGVDFGGLGVYWAKSASDASEPSRFLLRLERRF